MSYTRDEEKDLIYDEETGQYRSANQYFSKFSDGTNTYIVKDAEARSSLANKQDTLVSGTNIKTINNNSLLGSGNITLDSLPSQSGNSGKFLTTNGSAASWATVSIPTVDQTYSSNSTSTNALSHKAIADAKFLQNKSTASLNIEGDDSVGASQPFNTIIGYGARPYDLFSANMVAIGYGAKAKSGGLAIGENAITSASNAIQLAANGGASVTNSDANTFKVANGNGNFELMSADGKIPDDRLNTTIARTSDIPTVNNATLTIQKNSANVATFTANASSNVTANITVPTSMSDLSDANDYYTATQVDNAIASAVSSVYKPAGSVAYASLPTPASSNLGNVYNVTDSFTTDSRFVEGSGKTYPAGTNVVIIEQNSIIYYGWQTLKGPNNFWLMTDNPSVGDIVYDSSFNARGEVTAVAGDGTITTNYPTYGSQGECYRYSDNDIIIQPSGYFFDVLSGIVDLSGYVPTSRTINSKALTGNITLSANDVGALPDSTVIPTTTSQLTNNSGFITGISWGDITGTLSSQSDLNTALNNKADNSSVVHLSGDETINGGKTFNQAFIIGTTETHPNEGGQLIFKKSHNSTMAGDVVVDQNVNNLRVIGQSTSLGIIVPFYIDCENNKVYTATPVTGDNSTQVATTAFVKAQGYATTSQIPTVATTSTAGIVKPDGTTITITNDGTISAAGGSAYAMVIVDYTEEDE